MTAVTAPTRPSAGGDHAATGTGQLVRFLLRRDRIKLPAWLLSITFFVLYFNTALPTIAKTEADLSAFAQFVDGPVGAVLSGPGYGFGGQGLSYRVFFVGTYGLYFLFAAALMNILLVTRHTRAEEQSGRAELLRAGIVGRNAPLTATMVLAASADLVLAVMVGLATAGFGYPVADSLLFGAGVGAAGLVFAGVTAVTVQVTEYSRAASGMAGAVLGAAYVIRATGDSLTLHGSLLSWFSPLAWSQQTRPFVDARWWPLLLSVALAAAATAVGYRLAARRDHGAGLTAPRPGPARAAAWLRTPAALSLRLQRSAIVWWGVALVALGLMYGLLVGPMVDTFDDLSGDFVDIIMGGQDLLGGYLSFMALYDVVLVSVFAILAVRGLRTEESAGRAEPVLATATGRVRWMNSHLAVTAAATVAILTAAGLALGIGAAIGTGDASLAWDLTVAHVVRAPEAFVFTAVAALLYGAAPRALGLAWAVLAYAGLLAFFGPLLDPPGWLYDVSPLDHIARYPLELLGALPILLLTAVAALLAGAGLWAFARRDLRPTA